MAATQLYDDLIAQLVSRPNSTMASVLAQMLCRTEDAMQLSEQIATIDRLKGWLDSFRPLPVGVVRELKQRYDVRLPINLTQSRAIHLAKVKLS